MLYALLKTIHLLSLMVWIGGMFFTLYCLRPALPVLEGPLRVRLMHEVLRRFLNIVGVAVAAVLVSGLWMIASLMRTGSNAGLGFNMSLDLHVMVVLGIVMMLVFVFIRFMLFTRLQRAVAALAWPDAAAALERIRHWVTFNLALGVVVVVVTRLGTVG
jgi:uncharacterized membrane protein